MCSSTERAPWFIRDQLEASILKIPTEKGGPTLAIVGSPIPVASARPHLVRFKHRRRETVVCVLVAKATVES